MDENRLLKSFTAATTEIDESQRAVTATITTDSIDRDGEVVLPAGLDLADYRKNPVVFFGHDMKSLPIGKNLWIKPDGKGLIAKTQFANTKSAGEVWELVRTGFLKGFSIGFLPEKGTYGAPTTKEIDANPDWKGAKAIIRKAKLIEYSVVPVPSNQDALVRAYHAKLFELSDDLAKALNLTEAPKPTETARGLQRTTYRTFKKALRRAVADLDAKSILPPERVRQIVADTIHVAKGGV